MNDWETIQCTFIDSVKELQNKLPCGLNNKLLHEEKKISFWIDTCPAFDSKIYITPTLIGTYIDRDQCDLSCDFDAGIELTINFTFNYFESLLTKKSRLCRWLKDGIIHARSIDQWDGNNWMNTQGNPPMNSENYDKQFMYNNLIFETELDDDKLDFSELLAFEQN